MPLVELGLVNLIPDPCSFDAHLRDQMLHMAKSRTAGTRIDHRKEPRIERLLMKEDTQRNILSFPREVLRSQISRAMPNIDTARQEETLDYIEQLKERDPLAILQKDSFAGREGGQLSMMNLAPNLQITMYLAQATGASINTV